MDSTSPVHSREHLLFQQSFQNVKDGFYLLRIISTCSMCSAELVPVKDSFQSSGRILCVQDGFYLSYFCKTASMCSVELSQPSGHILCIHYRLYLLSVFKTPFTFSGQLPECSGQIVPVQDRFCMFFVLRGAFYLFWAASRLFRMNSTWS